MKTRSLFVALLFALACLFFSCKDEVSLEGNIYVGDIDGHPYAVFLESMLVEDDDILLSGHYLDISSSRADSVAFKLKTNKKSLYIEAALPSGKDEFLTRNKLLNRNLKLSSFDSDGFTADGKISLGLFVQKMPFHFELYRQQPFVSYANTRYRKPCYRVDAVSDICYGKARGYWDEVAFEDDNTIDLLLKLRETDEQRDLDLCMDIYTPQDDVLEHRPLIMLIHGGAFYKGTKINPKYVRWGEYFSSLGYVVASINYRLGFRVNLESIERTAYRALQDAHAAMRFLVEKRDVYGIDTSMIFVAGSSAGAITALNLAYMSDQFRPASSYAIPDDDLPDLGSVAGSGNAYHHHFDIKGVVNMWGAISDIAMLDHRSVPILSFHGDKDDIVPYNYDYPFKMVGSVKRVLFNKMYGSYPIQQRAEANHIPAELHTFKGWKHDPYIDKNDSINSNYFLIQGKMENFFRQVMVPQEPLIIASKSAEGVYSLLADKLQEISWEAEGGFIIGQEGNSVGVVWMNNAPRRVLRASGKLAYDYGFISSKKLK